ncbi:hypothetical protein [Thalassospira sp.]|uniref:hypothetical protein n=1 Tax=Thalassospira sp. TaxID=1912094 RepID=UPI001B237B32|nr:hypothetical protein [Thalassospira sp.]MBO6807951.1 hypothetical protein [Thalassospira sp.]MBO6842503.1 hypothetical protein [Thalassospira sp.]
MLRLFEIEKGLIREIKFLPEELGSHLTKADWIDAHEPDEDERALLQHMLRTELPESDEVEEIEASARCFVDQAGIHVHSLFLAQLEGSPAAQASWRRERHPVYHDGHVVALPADAYDTVRFDRHRCARSFANDVRIEATGGIRDGHGCLHQ